MPHSTPFDTPPSLPPVHDALRRIWAGEYEPEDVYALAVAYSSSITLTEAVAGVRRAERAGERL